MIEFFDTLWSFNQVQFALNILTSALMSLQGQELELPFLNQLIQDISFIKGALPHSIYVAVKHSFVNSLTLYNREFLYQLTNEDIKAVNKKCDDLKNKLKYLNTLINIVKMFTTDISRSEFSNRMIEVIYELDYSIDDLHNDIINLLFKLNYWVQLRYSKMYDTPRDTNWNLECYSLCLNKYSLLKMF